MQPCKSDSFRFQRNTSRNSSGSSTRSSGQQQCRKRLKDQFDDFELGTTTEKSDRSKNYSNRTQDSRNLSERAVFSVLNLNDTRKYLRNGAERISKTFNSMRTQLGTITQRFKIPTKRRQILEEGPMTPNVQTPYTRSRQVLGRTPTKLYSPFSIESPYGNSTTIDKENVPPQASSLIKFNQS